MINILWNEVYKIFARKKLYIFIFILFISVLFNVFMAKGYLAKVGQINGQVLPVIALDSVVNFILPFMLIILIADIVTGEYASGSLKLPLIRPVSRSQLLLAKVGALTCILIILLFSVMIFSYVLGTVLLTWGEVFLLKGITLSTIQGILFTMLIYVVSIIPLLAFGMIILLFAIVLANEGSVVGVGAALLIGLTFMKQILYEYSFYLINNYFSLYRLMTSGRTIEYIVFGFLIVIAYGIGFYLLSLYIFKEKDLLI